MPERRFHELKTWPGQFAQLADGSKTFEFRRNDRDFGVWNVLLCIEWDPAPLGSGGPRGFGLDPRWQAFEVTHMLTSGFGVPNGFVVMSIARLSIAESLRFGEATGWLRAGSLVAVNAELSERGSR